jgi:signal transduction histidine kinase
LNSGRDLSNRKHVPSTSAFLLRRWFGPLAGRILGLVLLVHAVLLPIVYLSLDKAFWQSASKLFETVAQDYAARLKDELGSGGIPLDDAKLRAYLVDLRATGFVTYAEVGWRDQVTRVPLVAPAGLPPVGTPDQFGSGDDRTYYVSTRWRSGTEQGTLRVGFDESPILDRVSEDRKFRLAMLSAYLVSILAAALALARGLARPLNHLRAAAEQIAGGDLGHPLRTRSGISEIDALSHDLERMRAELAANATRLNQKQRLETIGALAGGVSHEFNNVLVPIILFLESAQGGLPADHPSRASIGRALAVAERARDIVSKLLVFSGRGASASLQPMRLAAAVDEGVRLFSRLRPTYIELESDVDAAADPVRADAGIVIQVVMNLCTNAFQAIPVDGGRIGVALRNVAINGGRWVQLSITDSGCGMDARTKARMFEPFFTTRAIGQGSGLGLAVVHGLVSDMRGVIEVDSQPGGGTCVRILLPSAAEEA